MQLIIRLIVATLAVVITAYILPGVEITSFAAAFVVAIVLGVINTFLKPILVFLTLPITLVTLGLFTLVINALLVLLTDYLVPGFSVSNFWWALLFGIVQSIINSFLTSLTKER